MKRVVGIGGVFFKARDPGALRAWYEKHLGVTPQNESAFEPNTVAFRHSGHTVWGPFPADTTYFAPSAAPFMINYRVFDLDALLSALADEGVRVDGRVDEYPYGRFAWISDPEGNRIELWEPAPGR